MDTQIHQQEPKIKEILYKKEKTQTKRNMKALILHIGQVFGVNFTAVLVSYSDVENWLKILSLILAIFYSIIKIRKELK